MLDEPIILRMITNKGDHQAIYHHLQQGDLDLAAAELEAHIVRAKNELLKLFTNC